MKARTKTGARRQEGTASVEVVMMLPFFILAYAGLHFVHGRYLGREVSLTHSRACAWTYAKNGCVGDKPPECQSDSGGDTSSKAEDFATGPGMEIIDGIGNIPFIGELVKTPFDLMFGVPLATRSYQQVTLPSDPSLGPESFRVGGAVRGTPHYFTLCNTERQDWNDVAKDVFCRFVENKFPGC